MVAPGLCSYWSAARTTPKVAIQLWLECLVGALTWTAAGVEMIFACRVLARWKRLSSTCSPA
jgi:hypothetical protein